MCSACRPPHEEPEPDPAPPASPLDRDGGRRSERDVISGHVVHAPRVISLEIPANAQEQRTARRQRYWQLIARIECAFPRAPERDRSEAQAAGTIRRRHSDLVDLHIALQTG